MEYGNGMVSAWQSQGSRFKSEEVLTNDNFPSRPGTQRPKMDDRPNLHINYAIFYANVVNFLALMVTQVPW